MKNDDAHFVEPLAENQFDWIYFLFTYIFLLFLNIAILSKKFEKSGIQRGKKSFYFQYFIRLLKLPKNQLLPIPHLMNIFWSS